MNNKYLGCNVPCEPILVTMTAVQKSPEGSLQLALLHFHSMKSNLKYTNWIFMVAAFQTWEILATWMPFFNHYLVCHHLFRIFLTELCWKMFFHTVCTSKFKITSFFVVCLFGFFCLLWETSWCTGLCFGFQVNSSGVQVVSIESFRSQFGVFTANVKPWSAVCG